MSRRHLEQSWCALRCAATLCVLILLCVLVLLSQSWCALRCVPRVPIYMCPHNSMYVSSCYYICALILLYVCPHTTVFVPSYYCICVLVLLYMSPHSTVYVSSYYYICVFILLYVSSYYYIFVFTGGRRWLRYSWKGRVPGVWVRGRGGAESWYSA